MVRTLSVLLLALFFPLPSKADDKPFDVFLKEYSSTIFPEERDSLLTDFWRTALRKGIPYIEDNKTDVTFLYRGKDSVRLTGDFTSWAFRMPLRILQESDLWYIRLSFEPDARLDYKFVVGNGNEVLDPLNSKISPSEYGDRSELEMPDFVSSSELEEQKNVRKGSLIPVTVPSKFVNYDHKAFVYVPAGYENSRLSYPVVYFQNGSGYINFANARLILDNLIAAKTISPVIGVFIVSRTEATERSVSEYEISKSYETFFTTELIPFIDRKYHTELTPSSRLLVGAAGGGLASLSIAFNNPGLIMNVASQSGFVSFRNDTLASLFRQAPSKLLNIYLAVGTYEKNVGTVPQRESDFLTANRRLNKTLEQKQYRLRYREFHDGHSWSRWRTELPNILRWFFPPR